MKPEALVFSCLVLALAAACVALPTPVGDPVPAAVAVRDPAMASAATGGFLTAGTTPDATLVIPPAPKAGESRNDADWAIFRSTRALEGSDRWNLALSDDSYKPADILKDFSCAMNVELTLQNAPTVSAVLSRAATDSANAAAAAKEVYKRDRPFLHNEGNICIARSEGLMKSHDYPSGHASAGWIEGLVLAELAPDRSGFLLARARAYGESRIVCGVHNYSAVEAGRTNASGVFAALHGSADFTAAMATAKLELGAARSTGARPDAAACAREAELIKPLAVQ